MANLSQAGGKLAGSVAAQKLPSIVPAGSPQVAVVVNWNAEAHAGRCLQVLMARTVASRTVRVVDNARSDAFAAIARSVALVRPIEPGPYTGFARGNTLAVAAASPASEWIAMMNPDAFAKPRWLVTLLLAASAHAGFDVLAASCAMLHSRCCWTVRATLATSVAWSGVGGTAFRPGH